MPDQEFTASATIRRRRRIFRGVLGLLLVAVVYWPVVALWGELVHRLGQFGYGSIVYRRAQWASTAALASWIFLAAALATWVLSQSARAAFGLPPRPRSRLLRVFLVLRVVLAVPLLCWMLIWSLDEFLVRRVSWAVSGALGLGLVFCLMFAYDVPRLMKNAVSCLRSRLPLLRARSYRLGELPDGELVRARGRVAAGNATLNGHGGEYVYRRSIPGEGALEKEQTEAVPFLIEAGGASAWVDADPHRTVVETESEPYPLPKGVRGGASVALLPLGAEIEIIGRASSVQGVYRSSVERIGAGEDKLYLFRTTSGTSRRLLLVASVELLSALGLAACPIGLFVLWIYLGLLARGGG